MSSKFLFNCKDYQNDCQASKNQQKGINGGYLVLFVIKYTKYGIMRLYKGEKGLITWQEQTIPEKKEDICSA